MCDGRQSVRHELDGATDLFRSRATAIMAVRRHRGRRHGTGHGRCREEGELVGHPRTSRATASTWYFAAEQGTGRRLQIVAQASRRRASVACSCPAGTSPRLLRSRAISLFYRDEHDLRAAFDERTAHRPRPAGADGAEDRAVPASAAPASSRSPIQARSCTSKARATSLLNCLGRSQPERRSRSRRRSGATANRACRPMARGRDGHAGRVAGHLRLGSADVTIETRVTKDEKRDTSRRAGLDNRESAVRRPRATGQARISAVAARISRPSATMVARRRSQRSADDGLAGWQDRDRGVIFSAGTGYLGALCRSKASRASSRCSGTCLSERQAARFLRTAAGSPMRAEKANIRGVRSAVPECQRRRFQIRRAAASGRPGRAPARSCSTSAHSAPSGNVRWLSPVKAQRAARHSIGRPGRSAVQRAPYRPATARGYDVSPDRSKFLVIADPSAPSAGSRVVMRFVTNWQEELKARVR